MKFNNSDELIQYIKTIGENIVNFDIAFSPIVEDQTPLPEVVIPDIISEAHVSLLSLSNNPKILSKIDESISEHTLQVSDYSSVPFSCSTGKVSILDRTILTNICESDDSGPVIYLDISVNGDTHHNVPFKLNKTVGDSSDYIMQLNPKLLTDDK